MENGKWKTEKGKRKKEKGKQKKGNGRKEWDDKGPTMLSMMSSLSIIVLSMDHRDIFVHARSGPMR